MLHSLLTAIDKKVSFKKAAAHCDIPCKIYDPSSAQIAALSVIRFVDLILDIDKKESKSTTDLVTLARLTREKEIHAEKVKHEIRVIWGDFFKQPQFEEFPDSHDLVHKIMLTGSACKQHIDRDKAVELMDLVNQFAEYFWQAKDVATFRATCPYPPTYETVYPKLG